MALRPKQKFFRPVSWFDGLTTQSASRYTSHMLLELGRLGLAIRDIESYERPPHTKSVLSDLIGWLSEHPGEAFAKLVNWQTLDYSQIQSRLERDRSAKPRIEVSANITTMNNLSVRWHPGGWRNAVIDWYRTDYNQFNQITHRKWRHPPDFRWFVGDEDPTFSSRPSNELMYIRGVGNLRPDQRDNYGRYATYNADVVDSILICAVRSGYEGLIKQLGYSFEVNVIDAFDFETRDEFEKGDLSPYRMPIHRVVAWKLEDAVELQARRQREAAAEQDKRDRAEFANVTTAHGFTIETFVKALLRASSRKPTGPAPSGEHTNRNAAKELRANGFKVDAADVRRIRQLVERYNLEILPEALRSGTLASRQKVPLPSNNIVNFPGQDP
jgi:hypothetical protein